MFGRVQAEPGHERRETGEELERSKREDQRRAENQENQEVKIACGQMAVLYRDQKMGEEKQTLGWRGLGWGVGEEC